MEGEACAIVMAAPSQVTAPRIVQRCGNLCSVSALLLSSEGCVTIFSSVRSMFWRFLASPREKSLRREDVAPEERRGCFCTLSLWILDSSRFQPHFPSPGEVVVSIPRGGEPNLAPLVYSSVDETRRWIEYTHFSLRRRWRERMNGSRP